MLYCTVLASKDYRAIESFARYIHCNLWC